MFDKRIWIPVCLLLILVIGGLFYLHHIAKQHQEPVKIYKAAEVETPAIAPKPPPPGGTHETGHWHGDEWHAVAHDNNAEPPETTTSTQPSIESESWDFQTVYQDLREKYPDQTKNPPPFENLPVDLWDFEATKNAFMENFNFYVAQGGNKPEVFENSREVRIAFAVMESIHNAAKSWVGLYPSEQRAEIKEMHRSLRRFNGVKVNHDRVWELVHDEGYSVLEALKISREEGIK